MRALLTHDTSCMRKRLKNLTERHHKGMKAPLQPYSRVPDQLIANICSQLYTYTEELFKNLPVPRILK